jgi:hypothetical protein
MSECKERDIAWYFKEYASEMTPLLPVGIDLSPSLQEASDKAAQWAQASISLGQVFGAITLRTTLAPTLREMTPIPYPKDKKP